MNMLYQSLRSKWDALYGHEYANDAREIKKIQGQSPEEFFYLIFSKNLEEWNKLAILMKIYSLPTCFFCELGDEYRQMKKIMNFDHLTIGDNIKYIAPCHFLIFSQSEHRQKPSSEDILSLIKFNLESGLCIIGNLDNAGAGYPRHIHYQSMVEEIIPYQPVNNLYPITCLPITKLMANSSLEIGLINSSVLAYVFIPNDEQGKITISRLVSKINMPFNILFWQGRVYVVLRKKSIPNNTNGFKFAAAEVCGTYYTRSREFYDSATSNLIMDALYDVCYARASQMQVDFNQQLQEQLSEVENE